MRAVFVFVLLMLGFHSLASTLFHTMPDNLVIFVVGAMCGIFALFPFIYSRPDWFTSPQILRRRLLRLLVDE